MIDWARVLRLLKLAALEEHRSTGKLDKRAEALFPDVVVKTDYRTRAHTLYYVRLTHPEAGELYKVGVTSRSVAERFRGLTREWTVEVIFEQAFERVSSAMELEYFIKVLGEPDVVDSGTLSKLRTGHLLGNTETFVCDVLGSRPPDAELDYWLQDNAVDLLYEHLRKAGAPC